MSKWGRTLKPFTCPGCGRAVAAGAPMRLLELPNLKRSLVRCEVCAGSPVPPDLPATVEGINGRTKRMTPIRQLASRADWKAKQAGQ